MSQTAPKKRIAVKQIKAEPRFVYGYYQRIRLVSMYAILAIFLVVPWLRFNGRQAVQFDFAQGKIYLFAATLMPQDFFFFSFVFAFAALALFASAVYAGRVWCGYACPQTIWTHLFQFTEKLILGERAKRIKLNKAPWTAQKFGKKALVHALWLIFSAITAFTFVALAVGTDALLANPLHQSGITWLFFAIFLFATYANAGFMREQMCVQICPYGRFQSVMLDKDSLTVSYDVTRGEPRGAGKHHQGGDCVDCTMCVQVCPTGIDIRDGLQLACIQCAACVDACDEVMDKIGKPRGLVRYTSERELDGGVRKKGIRPKLVAYGVVMALVGAGATFTLMGREPLEIGVRHDRRALATATQDGRIENSYIITITNKTEVRQTYHLSMRPVQNLEFSTRFAKVLLNPNQSYDIAASVYAPASFQKGSTPIEFVVQNDKGDNHASVQNMFIYE